MGAKSEDAHILPSLENISYTYFFRNFLQPNLPCIIKNVCQNWKSLTCWTQSNKPCFDYLANKYGNSRIMVYKCDEKYFNSQETCQMNFKEYLNYWESYIENDYSNEMPLYYLKDWHLQNESKNDNFYEVPSYFSSDWLNEYLTDYNKDDYRFVYMGPKGSWTPFHQDVFSSYSWSANICGKKKWVLFPPNEEKKLLDELGNVPYDIGDIPEDIDYFEVIQNQGDALFVPSGWHHQVWNLDNTISINHNWVNGCNIKHIWKALEHNFFSVKKEISEYEDLENYSQQCQLILKATFGMHFEDFLRFLQCITLKRLKLLSNNPHQNQDTPTEEKYVIFDLYSLKEVLELFRDHKDLSTSPEMAKLQEDASHILLKILEKL